MPIIIGIILGLACFLSSVGFWSNLPNGDLTIAFTTHETIIRTATESGRISLLGLVVWGIIFIMAITALFAIMASVFAKEAGLSFIIGFMIGGFIGAIIGAIVGGIGAIIGVVTANVGGIGAVIGVVTGSNVGGYTGDFVTKIIKEDRHSTNKYLMISSSAFSTILILGIMWLLLRPTPPPPITFRDVTLVALEQSNQTLIAELTNNANATATERSYQDAESALQITQTAIFMLAQGTITIPTEQPSNTPQLAPTPDINITLTANAQAIESLEMQSTNTPVCYTIGAFSDICITSLEIQSTNTPEPTLTSQSIGEQSNPNNMDSVNIADTLRDPIWGGIAGIMAICGIPLALMGLYFAWKQSQK